MMYKNVVHELAAAAMLLLLVHTTAIAGGRDRAGTASGSQLLIPVGARYIAQGGAPNAVSEGIESIYWNPAGLAHMSNGSAAMFSYMPYIGDIGVSFGAAAVNLGSFGFLGISMKSLSMGTIGITTADLPDGTGETFSPNYFTLGLTYARGLTDQVYVGANFKIVSERLPRASATGLVLDAGIQYRNLGNVSGLCLGVVVKNLGPALKYDGPGLYRVVSDENSAKATSNYKIATAAFDLPSVIEIGLAYTYPITEFQSLTASYLFQNNNYSDDESKFGLELAFQKLLYLRGGYSLTPDKPEGYDYIFGVTFGAGIHMKTGGVDMFLDYAFRDAEFFDTGNVFSLKLGF
jgi:hypothetical protein